MPAPAKPNERQAQGEQRMLAIAPAPVSNVSDDSIAQSSATFATIRANGPQSDAQVNPVITIAAAARGGLYWRALPGYTATQVVAPLRALPLPSSFVGAQD